MDINIETPKNTFVWEEPIIMGLWQKDSDSGIFMDSDGGKSLKEYLDELCEEVEECDYLNFCVQKKKIAILKKGDFLHLFEPISDSAEQNEAGEQIETIIEMRFPKKKLDQVFPEESNMENIYYSILSNISYKLRGPLAVIIGANESVKKKKIKKSYVQMIKDSSSDIFYVVNEIYDMMNIKEKNIIEKKTDMRIIEFIEIALNNVLNAANQSKIKLLHHIDEELAPVIKADQDKLLKIVIVFLKNAINAINVKRITLSVEKKNSTEIEISVTNDGLSMDQEKINLATLFIETGKTGKYPEGKHGFGLFIASYFCNIINSNIFFNSVPKFGTVFSFIIKY